MTTRLPLKPPSYAAASLRPCVLVLNLSERHRRPNTYMANIQALPAELITAILLIVRDGLVDHGWTKAPPSMFLSHVCGRWRALALACQELWSTFLPRRSVEWTQICLARCHSKPLSITIDAHYGDAGGMIEATALVMGHWSRIRTLSMRPSLYPADNAVIVGLDEESEAHLTALFKFLARPSECLEELEFNMGLEVGLIFDVWIPVRIPETLFSNECPPRLHSLKLTRCWLPAAPPSPLVTPNIRTLELRNTKAWPDVDSMIQYLRAMPKLERFTYQFWETEDIFDCRPSLAHQARCVELPCLEYITLDGFWLQNITIFSYIAIPSHCSVIYNYREWEHIDDIEEATVLQTISMYGDALRQHFTPVTSNGVFYSTIETTDVSVEAEIDLHTQVSGQLALLPSDTKSYFYFPVATNARIRQAACQIYLTQPIMTKATRLILGAGAWKLSPDVFEEYTAVRELCLMEPEEEDVAAFTVALRLKGTSLFPNVKRVVLADLVVVTGQELLRELAEALRDTYVTGGSFECVELDHCHRITETQESEMRAVLGADRIVRNHLPTT